MLPFRLSKNAHKWFRGLERGFNSEAPMYEVFYFCAMAGLAARRKSEIPSAETTELVNYFPGEYRAKGRLIVALFLSREIHALGIKTTERKALHAAVADLVHPLSPSYLSEAGVKELNKYSHGGFDVLAEEFANPPQAIETFLPLFKQFIDRTAQ